MNDDKINPVELMDIESLRGLVDLHSKILAALAMQFSEQIGELQKRIVALESK